MLETLKRIIAEQAGVEEASLTEETSLKKDLGMDSLELLSVVMAIEEEYDLEVPEDELNQVDTLEDLVEYLKGRGIEE
ncbi:MAG TPA: acyl carrier protein [Candidatus Caccomorpha excrementavium]|nr:acyl carrier protein [Candidatus Caccomorpha excrementavium]